MVSFKEDIRVFEYYLTQEEARNKRIHNTFNESLIKENKRHFRFIKTKLTKCINEKIKDIQFFEIVPVYESNIEFGDWLVVSRCP